MIGSFSGTAGLLAPVATVDHNVFLLPIHLSNGHSVRALS